MAIARLMALMIHRGEYEIERVPQQLKAQVLEELQKLGGAHSVE